MTTFADLEALGYMIDRPPADDPAGPAAVRGYGVAIMVAADDAAALDGLADAAAHRERVFQATMPEAHEAKQALVRAGFAVTRPDPSVDAFDVTPEPRAPLEPLTATPAVKWRKVKPEQLLLVLEQLDGLAAAGPASEPASQPPAPVIPSGP